MRRPGERKTDSTDCWCGSWAEKGETAGAAGMLEPLRNLANWDRVRKAVVLLLLSAAASVLFCIIYLWGVRAAPLRRRTYSGRLFCLSPLSLRPIARLVEIQVSGRTGGEE